MSEPAVLDSPEAIAAHLSESIARADRGRRGLRFVLCDENNRVRLHCPVDRLPASSEPAECAEAVSVFAGALVASEANGALLVVLTRPGSATVTDAERVWFHSAYEVCAKMGVRLLGIHLMTPNDQREIVLDDAL